MQKTLTAAVFAAALGVSGAACAADLNAARSMKDPAAYMPANTWAGFYLGVNGGYGWGAKSTMTVSAYEDGDDWANTNSARVLPEGGFGGGQIGYNVQRDRFVFGIEADIQTANISDHWSSEAVSIDGDVVTDATAKASLNWFGTVRGRIGYSIGNSLLFATGGLAFGGVKDSLTHSVWDYYTDGATASASKNTTLTGYVVGGGIETALSPSWSVKAEYQYIDLGSTTLSTNSDITYGVDPVYTDNGNASVKVDHTYHTVRVGLNYRLAQPYEPLK
jgi:outer membrane immunogenic protein